MKKRFIFLLLLLLIIPFVSNLKVNGKSEEEFKYSINVEASEGVDVTVVDRDSNTELGNSFGFNDEIKIKITATPKEGYRIVLWTNEYIKITNGQSIHQIQKTNTPTEFRFTPKQSYTIRIFAVKESNYGVVVLNYVNGFVMKFQEVESGELIDFPKTNGKGVGLFKTHIKISEDEYVPYENSGVYEDLTVYAEYDKEATTIGTIFKDYYPMFFKGLGKTLLFSVIAVFLSLFLGTAVCLLKMSDVKIINFIASAYIEVIRGVPLLLQLLIIYTVLPNMNYGSFFTTEVIACLLSLFINSSAYVAEIIRSGIQAVDKGQTEAARALGLSKWQTLFKIVIPQGIKNCLPSIGNELIMVIKETSLASTVNVAIGELMSVQNQIKADSYIVLEPFFIIAIMYFIVTFSLSKVVRLIERRLETHD